MTDEPSSGESNPRIRKHLVVQIIQRWREISLFYRASSTAKNQAFSVSLSLLVETSLKQLDRSTASVMTRRAFIRARYDRRGTSSRCSEWKRDV
jgi:hypothetical protein